MGRHTLPAHLSGRHRLSRSDRVHCRRNPAVAELLNTRSGPSLAWLRAGRHTFGWLSRSGAAPRPAFVLIMSL